MTPIPFPSLIQRYFADHLITQRNVSPQTVAAYRDTFRLLLQFLSDYHHRPVDHLTFAMLAPEAVLAFSVISKPSATTPFEPAPHGWLPSVASYISFWRSPDPTTSLSVSVFSRSPSSAAPNRLSGS